jgi:hypothetical protein
MRFALGIAGLSAAWLATSQIEKALLADRLSLSGYGAYSLGVHVASVIILGVGTIHGAVLPRMTRQVAAGDMAPMRELYGLATALTVAVSCAVVVAIAIGGRTLVPSLRVAVDGIDPLQVAWLYGFGNMAVALLALAYQLQNARGRAAVPCMGHGAAGMHPAAVDGMGRVLGRRRTHGMDVRVRELAVRGRVDADRPREVPSGRPRAVALQGLAPFPGHWWRGGMERDPHRPRTSRGPRVGTPRHECGSGGNVDRGLAGEFVGACGLACMEGSACNRMTRPT